MTASWGSRPGLSAAKLLGPLLSPLQQLTHLQICPLVATTHCNNNKRGRVAFLTTGEEFISAFRCLLFALVFLICLTESHTTSGLLRKPPALTRTLDLPTVRWGQSQNSFK